MLHTPVTDRKNKAESTNSAMLAENEQQKQAVNWLGQTLQRSTTSVERSFSIGDHSDLTMIQQAYGNQAALRKLRTEKGRSPGNLVQGGVLQRKCACGNSAGATGGCAECQGKREGILQTKLQIGEAGDRYEQDAAPMMTLPDTTIHPIDKEDEIAGIEKMSSFISIKQLPPGEEDVGEDYLDRFLQDEFIPGKPEEALSPQIFQDTINLLGIGDPIRVGSGTCRNGGGKSTCNLDTGTYEITSNDNTCCTKNCTQQHEMQHVIDHTAWGCCKKFSEELKSNANPGAVKRVYKEWFDIVAPITECHAYRNDVKCIQEMEKAKECKGKGATSDCCADIADYKTRYSSLEQKHCSEAPQLAPPCPPAHKFLYE
jgi:hypothetical protein